MKVSVIVPVYQAEKYLPICLTSLINQTLDDYEIILVNDGSTDQSLTIINHFKSQSDKIKLINQENQGIIEAKKNGLKEARGEYILFMDNDDWLDHEALLKLYQHAKQTDADLVFYDFIEVVETIGYYKKLFKDNWESFKKDPFKELMKSLPCPLWTKLIKRQYIQRSEIHLPSNICYWEDVATSASLYMHEPTITYYEEYLYYWNNHTESLSSKLTDDCLHDVISGFNFIMSELKLNNKYHENKLALHQYLYNTVSWAQNNRNMNPKYADGMLEFYKQVTF